MNAEEEVKLLEEASKTLKKTTVWLENEVREKIKEYSGMLTFNGALQIILNENKGLEEEKMEEKHTLTVQAVSLQFGGGIKFIEDKEKWYKPANEKVTSFLSGMQGYKGKAEVSIDQNGKVAFIKPLETPIPEISVEQPHQPAPIKNNDIRVQNCLHAISRIYSGSQASPADVARMVKELYNAVYGEPF